jgi:hypothetical protein
VPIKDGDFREHQVSWPEGHHGNHGDLTCFEIDRHPIYPQVTPFFGPSVCLTSPRSPCRSRQTSRCSAWENCNQAGPRAMVGATKIRHVSSGKLT